MSEDVKATVQGTVDAPQVERQRDVSLARRANSAWRQAVRATSGLCKPWGIKPEEAEAALELAQALEEDLAGPASAADDIRIGIVAGCQLIRWRLQRRMFNTGLINEKTRQVNPALGEWRQVAKLQLDALNNLKFRDPGVIEADIRELWQASTESTTAEVIVDALAPAGEAAPAPAPGSVAATPDAPESPLEPPAEGVA
jgi:hypothetical protein